MNLIFDGVYEEESIKPLDQILARTDLNMT